MLKSHETGSVEEDIWRTWGARRPQAPSAAMPQQLDAKISDMSWRRVLLMWLVLIWPVSVHVIGPWRCTWGQSGELRSVVVSHAEQYNFRFSLLAPSANKNTVSMS